MIGYEVLGEPEGRKWIIRGIASHLYNKMTDDQREIYLSGRNKNSST